MNLWHQKLIRQLFRKNVPLSSQAHGLTTTLIISHHKIGSQGTASSGISENYLDILAERPITKQANDFLKNIDNRALVVQAEIILAIIQREVIKANTSIELPPIAAFSGEDGSLLLEWIFPDFRIGFNLEVDDKDRGWYLASKPTAGGIIASGFLDGVNLPSLITWLISFATLRLI